jgi:hypothetical protein
VVRITPADSDRQRALDRLGELQQEVLSRTSLAHIIQQPALNLYPEDRKRMPLEDVVENMRKALRFQVMQAWGGGVPAFLISFEYPDKFKAQAVVRELLSSFFRQNRLERGDQGPSAAEILEVLDPANLPQRSFYPNRPMIVAAGLLGGAVLGLLVVLVWRGAAWLGKDKKVVAAVALAGALAAGVFAFRIPDRYVSTAVMRFIPAGPADSDRQRALDRLQQMTHQIVSDRDTAFRKALRIQLLQPQGGGVRAFSISCEYPDNLKAQAVVRDVVARFFRLNQGPSAIEILEVLDPASLPARPLAPNRPMIVTAGLFGGAVLGLLAVLMWRSTLHSQKT